MPASSYNRYFGGDDGSAAKAKKAMIAKYGAEKGKSVFHGYVENEKRGRPHGKRPARKYEY